MQSTDCVIVTTYEGGVEIASGASVNALERRTAQAQLAVAGFADKETLPGTEHRAQTRSPA